MSWQLRASKLIKTALFIVVGGLTIALTTMTQSAGAQSAGAQSAGAQSAGAQIPNTEVDNRPTVYLTFDDGPSPHTPAYLDLLERYGAKGTFFAIGPSVEARPEVAQRIIDDGHALANHTWTHPNLARSSASKINFELTRSQQAFRTAVDMTPTCFRPPYGATNSLVYSIQLQHGLTNAEWSPNRPGSYQVAKVSPHAGTWDIDTSDYKRNSRTIAHELSKIEANDIVLMHDLHSASLAPLEQWLAANHHRFQFEALPGCGAIDYSPCQELVEALSGGEVSAWVRQLLADADYSEFTRSELACVGVHNGAPTAGNSCAGRQATLVGTNAGEVLLGTDGDDVIVARAGKDLVLGGGGNDVICGGDGDDNLIGGVGNDTLHGQAGSDSISGQVGTDNLTGGLGNDRLHGGVGNDTLHGNQGNDQLRGGPGHDQIRGGSGHDHINGNKGDDKLFGGAGNDNILGNEGSDKLHGKAGTDTLLGGVGNDTLHGNQGNDQLRGGPGHDQIRGGSGHDHINGNKGDDKLFGGAGNDNILGNEGNDELYGAAGTDTLLGGRGSDQLHDSLD